MMLRITINETSQVRTLRLEGRLGTPSLQELERCWADALASRKQILQVDLTGVTSIDSDDKATLKTMHQGGAEFIAEDCLMIAIVEELAQATNEHLPTRHTGYLPPTNEERKSR